MSPSPRLGLAHLTSVLIPSRPFVSPFPALPSPGQQEELRRCPCCLVRTGSGWPSHPGDGHPHRPMLKDPGLGQDSWGQKTFPSTNEGTQRDNGFLLKVKVLYRHWCLKLRSGIWGKHGLRTEASLAGPWLGPRSLGTPGQV